VEGATKTEFPYPGFNKLSDEGGKAIKENLIYFTEPDAAANAHADWFTPNKATGLTQAGHSRIIQSIEALVCCILGT